MPGIFIILFVVFVVIAIIAAGKTEEANEQRIREKMRSLGYTVKSIDRLTVTDFKFQSQHARAYRVKFQTDAGRKRQLNCITGKHIGVFFQDAVSSGKSHDRTRATAATPARAVAATESSATVAEAGMDAHSAGQLQQAATEAIEAVKSHQAEFAQLREEVEQMHAAVMTLEQENARLRQELNGAQTKVKPLF